MSVTPSALDVQDAQLENRLERLHTCMPAEIVRVHAEAHQRQFVDVLPSLQRSAFNEDGELVMETLPIIPMVPVGYMQGGGFFVSLPLAVGDFVLVHFAERSLDQWLEVARKGARRATPPGDEGTHTLEGAVALPCGPAPRPELLVGVDATDLVIGGPGGILARFTPAGQIRLAEGPSGESYVALADATNAELADLKHELAALKMDVNAGLGAVTAPGGGPAIVTARAAAVILAAALPPWAGSVAATKVKAR